MSAGLPVKTFSFGSCNFAATSPAIATLSPNTKKLNIVIEFEDALKLNLAIDECVRQLNRYKRSTKGGKRTALNLTVHLDIQRIGISETRLTK